MDSSKAPNKRIGWAIIVIAVILIVIEFIHSSELVDHVPEAYSLTWGILGFAAGATFSIWRKDALLAKGWRGWLALLSAPVMLILVSEWLGRLAYEGAGFVSYVPAATKIVVPIVNMSSGKSGPHAIVKVDEQSREIWVSVSNDLYSKLDAYRYPGRDCLTLTVETGRYGIRRALIPSTMASELDVGHLSACPQAIAQWAETDH